MNITFHEFRYILHLKDYDSGVFFYREVLGLQPNYNWSIVPDQKGYRFYMGTGRLEITQFPSPHCRDEVSFWGSALTCPCVWSAFGKKCPPSRFSLRIHNR